MLIINIKSKWSKIFTSNISLNYNYYDYGNDLYYQEQVLKYSPMVNQDTNPYVSAWLKSSDNTSALDWKSDRYREKFL